MPSVDLNADMGESFGNWNMGNDPVLMETITSANIACGFHAGDPDVMSRTMKLAMEHGVAIGAHPGFPDLQGFGRRRMHIPLDSMANMIRYQVGASFGVAKSVGARVTHFKMHGALSNMACVDIDLARACIEAVRGLDPDITILAVASTAIQSAAEELECKWAAEIFADRAYNDDATLVDRGVPGAVIHDPDVAAERVRDMVRQGAIIAASGKKLPTRIDTICVHGDKPAAVKIAQAVRAGLEQDGVAVKAP